MSRSYSNIIKRAVIHNVKHGMPYRHAAIQYGVHNRTVMRWCQSAGVRSAWSKWQSADAYTPQERVRALRLVRDGVGMCDVTRQTGIPRSTVLRWRQQEGLPVGAPIMPGRKVAA